MHFYNHVKALLLKLIRFSDDSRRTKPIFDHEGIVVNQEEHLLAGANTIQCSQCKLLAEKARKPRSYTRSRTRSPRNRSASSSYRRRSRSGSQKRTVDKDRRNVVNKSTERRSLEREGDRRRSLDRDSSRKSEKERYRGRLHSRERDEDRYRKRSQTPLRPGEYRPSRSDVRPRSSSHERHIPHDKYRAHGRRSRSLSRDRYRKYPSPDHHAPSTSRRPSRSPRRSPSPPRGQDRTRLPSSPGRYDRYSRRHSRSPDRYSSRRSPPKKRSRSPHPPIVTFDKSRSGHSRSTRSPGYERDRSYRSDRPRRSRSRSPRKHKNEPAHPDPNAEFAFYGGIPGSEFWIPGPIRAGFPPNSRFYPPALYPRIPGGAPIFLPFRGPMLEPYGMFRPRLPVYNSRVKQKVNPQVQAAGDDAPSTGGASGSNPSTSAGNSGEGRSQERPDTEGRKDDSGDNKNSDGKANDN